MGEPHLEQQTLEPLQEQLELELLQPKSPELAKALEKALEMELLAWAPRSQRRQPGRKQRATELLDQEHHAADVALSILAKPEPTQQEYDPTE